MRRGLLRSVLPVAAAMEAVCLILAAPASAGDPFRHHLQQTRQHAANLHHQEAHQRADARAARQRLLRLSQQANAALAAADQARTAAAAAHATLVQQRAALAAARARAAAAQQRLAAYAASAYASGATAGADTIGMMLQSSDPMQTFNDVPLLHQAGASMANMVSVLQSSQQAEAAAAQRASAAAAQATLAVNISRAASRDARVAVAAQAKVLAHVRQQVLATRTAAAAADAATAQAKRQLQEEIAAARARAAENGGVPKCLGGDVAAYPNGKIPIQMLCPLWGALGQELRKHAAARFNEMSRAFDGKFGTPMCLADSYRTYQRQVQLYAERPHYAAHPGTSEHGWGLAVDLCGGIETDGTPQNIWMRTHAAQFGWFHPTWADQGGGGPYEPWHWEFAG